MSELKELPKGWKWVISNEIMDVRDGTHDTPQYVFENGIPLITSKNLKDNKISFEKINYVSIQDHLEISKRSNVEEGDILFAMIGTIGNPAIIRGDANFSIKNVGLFKKNVEAIMPEFFFNFLRSFTFEKQLNDRKLLKGTTQKFIPLGSLRKINIPLPPLPIQQAIVSKIEELFSELDKGVENLKTAQQQLKVYRQSVLKWAFEGKLTSLNHDSLDLPDEQDLPIAAEPQAIYQSKKHHGNQENLTNQAAEKGGLPEGWKRVNLGEVCSSVEYGSAIKSKKEGKVPVLRMGNIQNGRFDWSDLVYTDDEKEIGRYLLKKDDVLFNRTNSAELVGKTAIYKEERPAIFAGYLIRINRIENLLDANYITYYLNSLGAKKHGNSVRSFGVNQSNINGTKLRSYPIPLPPILEQTQIVQEIESRLSVVDKMEETIQQSLLQAESLRQSILKKAFEGELVK